MKVLVACEESQAVFTVIAHLIKSYFEKKKPKQGKYQCSRRSYEN